MAGPWERYQAAPAQPGPWSRYASSGAQSEMTPAQFNDRWNGQPASMSAGEVAQSAVQNLVPSAQRFGSDIVSAVTNPVETVTNMGRVAAGAVEKLIPGQQQHEPYADAVGQFFANRYGGLENVKRTIAEDPVGFAADIATVLTGGEAALARAAPTVGRAVGTAARAVDPLSGAALATKLAAKAAGKGVSAALGVSTGAGGKAVQEAARAGFAGGERAKAFRDNMRGRVPMEQVIADAKAGVEAIKQERQTAYRAGMADLSQDTTVLDFTKIDRAINSARPVKEFRGRTSGISVTLEPSARETTGEIAQVLDEWRNLPPGDFHTPEGLDALKQRLNDIRKGTKPGSASEAIATQVYNIVKRQIVAQAPQYAKTMEDYAKASDLISEMESTLSLNRRAKIDTQLRKLQSVLRNNVNTTYGRRVDLVKLLEEKGASNLLAKLAGQSLNSAEPRGLSRAVAGVVGAGGGGASLLNPAAAVPTLATLATMSPRLVGEASYLGGRTLSGLSRLPAREAVRAGYQLRGADQGKRP